MADEFYCSSGVGWGVMAQSAVAVATADRGQTGSVRNDGGFGARVEAPPPHLRNFHLSQQSRWKHAIPTSLKPSAIVETTKRHPSGDTYVDPFPDGPDAVRIPDGKDEGDADDVTARKQRASPTRASAPQASQQQRSPNSDINSTPSHSSVTSLTQSPEQDDALPPIPIHSSASSQRPSSNATSPASSKSGIAVANRPTCSSMDDVVASKLPQTSSSSNYPILNTSSGALSFSKECFARVMVDASLNGDFVRFVEIEHGNENIFFYRELAALEDLVTSTIGGLSYEAAAAYTAARAGGSSHVLARFIRRSFPSLNACSPQVPPPNFPSKRQLPPATTIGEPPPLLTLLASLPPLPPGCPIIPSLPGSVYEVNIPSAVRTRITRAMAGLERPDQPMSDTEAEPTVSLFDAAADEVLRMMYSDTFQRFVMWRRSGGGFEASLPLRDLESRTSDSSDRGRSSSSSSMLQLEGEEADLSAMMSNLTTAENEERQQVEESQSLQAAQQQGRRTKPSKLNLLPAAPIASVLSNLKGSLWRKKTVNTTENNDGRGMQTTTPTTQAKPSSAMDPGTVLPELVPDQQVQLHASPHQRLRQKNRSRSPPPRISPPRPATPVALPDYNRSLHTNIASAIFPDVLEFEHAKAVDTVEPVSELKFPVLPPSPASLTSDILSTVGLGKSPSSRSADGMSTTMSIGPEGGVITISNPSALFELGVVYAPLPPPHLQASDTAPLRDHSFEATPGKANAIRRPSLALSSASGLSVEHRGAPVPAPAAAPLPPLPFPNSMMASAPLPSLSSSSSSKPSSLWSSSSSSTSPSLSPSLPSSSTFFLSGGRGSNARGQLGWAQASTQPPPLSTQSNPPLSLSVATFNSPSSSFEFVSAAAGAPAPTVAATPAVHSVAENTDRLTPPQFSAYQTTQAGPVITRRKSSVTAGSMVVPPDGVSPAPALPGRWIVNEL
ncbi:hypothetical protein DFJ73DRAFT_844217 [Zopfochytrium polystomum]|nr:hypothetical protein DFJ73DRAFT_844217 [Zopfochytrium polystomum]